MRVSPEELARLQSEIGKTSVPYGMNDLDGAFMDCDHALFAGGFTSPDITRTGATERMVIYRCRPNWEPHTTDEVVARLEESWLTHGALRQEAHAVTAKQSEVALDFVTWWDGGSFYTGRIEVVMHRHSSDR